MPRLFLSFLALSLSLTPFAWGGEKGKEDKGKVQPLQITYYGQSFYTVASSKGTVVAFDPHAIEVYKIEKVRADIVFITHEHNEHNVTDVIDGVDKAKVKHGLDGPGLKANWIPIDETIKDVQVRSIGTFHDGAEGSRYGKNTIFVIEVDGWKIAHLGDLGHELTTRQLRQIGPVDVVMIPVGGIYTLNGSEAKRVVEQLKPKEYIFPMHYGTKLFEDLLPINEFLEDQPARMVVKSEDNKLLLNKDATRPRPLIVQLHYWPKEIKEEKKDKK
jgi:L-ascorbate metabolism protein UlaG (beta-lactamase superfamily)